VAIPGWRGVTVWTNSCSKLPKRATLAHNGISVSCTKTAWTITTTRSKATGRRPCGGCLAAAEQGLPRAQIKLAEMYAVGSDIAASYVTACGWFPLATTSLRGIHLHRAQLTRFIKENASTRGAPCGSHFDDAIPRRARIFGLAAMGHARNSARDRDRSRTPCHRVRRLHGSDGTDHLPALYGRM
jgi:hypothetical protein